MKRLLSPALILALLLPSIDCGFVFIGGAIQTSTIRGAVSIVQLSSDGSVEVTFVTLVQNGIPSTIGFCGDQRAMFPMDQTVRVNFSLGQPCATVITVVIV